MRHKERNNVGLRIFAWGIVAVAAFLALYWGLAEAYYSYIK